jgi:hypothetical protein
MLSRPGNTRAQSAWSRIVTPPHPEICAEAIRVSCIKMKSAPKAPALRM